MTRYLFAVLPTRGHMYPALPVAQALRERGDDVSFITVPEFGPLIERQGMVYLPLEHGGAGAARPLRRADEGDRVTAREAFRASFIAPIVPSLPSLETAITAWRPDVVVADYVSYAPAIAGERAGIPVATLHMTVFSWPGGAMAPFGLGLPPADDDATRARYAAMRATAEDFYAPVVEELNAIRQAAGLEPRRGSIADVTLSRSLCMVQTVPALDYQRADLPAHVHYTGPCHWDPPVAMAPATADWLAALPAGKRLVLVAASGAFTGTARLVQTALTAFADADYAVLATLPFDHPLHHAAAPPHIHVTRFAPHSQFLPRAAAVVTHGGFGMASKALAHGRPLVVVPWAADQPEVAQRVVWAGAGVRLGARVLGAARLRDAVEEVLAIPTYRLGAEHLAALMAAQDGPATAATLLNRLAASGQPVLRNTFVAEPPGLSPIAAARGPIGGV